MEKNQRKRVIAIIQERGRNTRLIENASPKVLNRIKECQNGIPIPSMIQYTDAIDAISKLDPAWSELSGSEQDILMGLYGKNRLRNGTATALSEKLEITERQVFRRSAQALQHFYEVLHNHELFEEESIRV
jgi:hypothetical protein